MIQRIQSIFLLIAAILAFFAIFMSFPVLESTVTIAADNSEKIIRLGIGDLSYMEESKVVFHKNTYISIALGIIGLISAVSIFLFKNRPLQIKITLLNCIAILLLGLGLLYQYYSFLNNNDEFSLINYKFIPLGYIIWFGMLLFNYLGLKYIKKDDHLVKSADRFR